MVNTLILGTSFYLMIYIFIFYNHSAAAQYDWGLGGYEYVDSNRVGQYEHAMDIAFYFSVLLALVSVATSAICSSISDLNQNKSQI
ncbi:MAG: hypothetical protein HRU15_00300 [Planctomycetes bacterium]|nr:hypothetical protein [Planctomycetota bacterium]